MVTMAKVSIKKFLAFFIIIIGTASLLRTLVLNIDINLQDFQIYYDSVKILQSAENPYIYPGPTPSPLFLYLLYPLTYFNSTTAANIWTIASILFGIFSIFLLYRHKKMNLLKISIVFLLLALSFPFKFTTGMGQVNLLVLFLITLFLLIYKRHRFTSSALLVIAGFIKIFPLALILVAKDRKVFKFSLFLFILFLLVTYLLSSDVFIYYSKDVFIPLLTGSKGVFYYNQSLDGFFNRVELNSVIGILIRLALLITVTLIIFLKEISIEKRVSLFIVTFLIISSVTWQHHLVFLLIPFYFLYANLKSYSSIFLLALAYLLVSFNIKNPLSVSFLAPIILSHGVFGMFILLYLLLKNSVK